MSIIGLCVLVVEKHDCLVRLSMRNLQSVGICGLVHVGSLARLGLLCQCSGLFIQVSVMESEVVASPCTEVYWTASFHEFSCWPAVLSLGQ